MGVSYGTGAVSLTVQASSPSIAIASQSVNMLAPMSAVRSQSAGTSTLGTVPAGKQWRVIGLTISCRTGSNVANIASSQLKLNGVTAIDAEAANVTAGANSANLSLNFLYSACPILATGQTITLVSDAQSVVGASAFVIEEATGTI